jgi:hypothetical protein
VLCQIDILSVAEVAIYYLTVVIGIFAFLHPIIVEIDHGRVFHLHGSHFHIGHKGHDARFDVVLLESCLSESARNRQEYDRQ